MSEEEFQREPEEDGLKEKIESCGAKTIGEFLLYEREKQGRARIQEPGVQGDSGSSFRPAGFT